MFFIINGRFYYPSPAKLAYLCGVIFNKKINK